MVVDVVVEWLLMLLWSGCLCCCGVVDVVVEWLLMLLWSGC